MKTIMYALAVICFAAVAVKLVSLYFVIGANKAYSAGNNDSALKKYNLAAKLPMASASTKLMHALMLMRCGKFAEAERILSEIVLTPNAKPQTVFSAKAYRCMARQKQGKTEDAAEEAEELFEVCKNTVTYGMVGYLRQLGGGAELEFCREAYEYNRDDRDICDNLTVAYIRSGDLDNAEKLAERLRQNFPDFAEAFYHSAQIALKKGDKSTAEKYIGRLEECHFTAMTTVTEQEINELKEEIKNA